MLNQYQGLKQLQKLSPQQIQLMKLLQIPTAQLDQRIKEELESNPALDAGEDDEEEDGLSQSEIDVTLPTEISEVETLDSENVETSDFDEIEEPIQKEDDLDLSDYYDEAEEEVADYKTRDTHDFADPDDENKTIPVATHTTFFEYLEEQVALQDFNEREELIAYHLVGNVDDDGYLRRDLEDIVDDLSFGQNITTDVFELKLILITLQKLDPPGVCARTLEECLILQLKRKVDRTNYTVLAIKILEKHFEAFSKKHYDKIEKALNISSADLKFAIDEIIKLNPKPGSAFAGKNSPDQFIIPDYLITNNNGELVLTLNSANAPELRISNSFKEMLSDYKVAKTKSRSQKEAVMFIKQKIESARWFIDAIQQRQNTMISVMQCIIQLQYDYLTTGDEMRLKPMILKDIADRTNLDISTISRVANSKYVQTEFGTLLLKSFFSEGMVNDMGEEISTREIKKILADLISLESKSNPLSDQLLMEELVKKGYNVARRTVAKYRETLNYPVARLRKEL